jgi:16S rRNA (uracil1498-N3)-methyltransferase
MTDPSHFLFFSSCVENGAVFLDKDESRHAFSVLRRASGETIRITDGKGSIYECTIHEQTPQGTRCIVKNKVTVLASQKKISLYVGLPEKEVFEGLCENLASLGVSEIIPMECDCCQERWWKGWEKQAPRFTKKMVAGLKQAKSACLPLLSAPQQLAGALGKGALMIAADENGVPFVDVIDRIKKAAAVSCFVGPPGGFSPKEIDMLKSSGAILVSLSRNRLRTELAAIVLCGMIKGVG